MDTGMRTYGDELVAVLSAATAVLSDLPARVHRLTGPDLAAVLPLVDRLPVHHHRGRRRAGVRTPRRRPGPPTLGRRPAEPSNGTARGRKSCPDQASMMLVVRSTKLPGSSFPHLLQRRYGPVPIACSNFHEWWRLSRQSKGLRPRVGLVVMPSPLANH